MNKLILVFCLAVAVAQAERARNDDYISLNRLQNNKIVEDYDRQLEFFEEHYNGRVETALTHREFMAAAVVQNEKRLSPFRLLGDYYKNCVVKHSVLLPSVSVAKKTITACEYEASKQLVGLLSKPRDIRNELAKYLIETYNEHLNGCAEEYGISSPHYTECVKSVTALANTFTVANQKQFAIQLEAAVCSAKAHIKSLLNCIFTEQTRVGSLISQVNVLVTNCFAGKDECKPCEKYTCADSYELDVNTTSETIKNPFLGAAHHNGCLMLSAKKH